MKANIEEKGSVLVVHLDGFLDYNFVEQFSGVARKHLVGKSVVFNLKNLSFAGSIGISDLVNTLTNLSKTEETKIRFAEANVEYQRVLAASEISDLKIYEGVENAQLSLLGQEVPEIPLPFSDAPTAASAPASNLIVDGLADLSVEGDAAPATDTDFNPIG